MKYDLTVGGFRPWQPSTWPEAPNAWDPEFMHVVVAIFDETIVREIENVIADVLKSNGSLAHRGHVVALSLLCAIDTVSSYAYKDLESITCQTCGRGDRVGPRYKEFIERHFPAPYPAHAHRLYSLYRNSLVHSWHLFRVAVLPGDEPVEVTEGGLSFGLLHFRDAFTMSIRNFLTTLDSDAALQRSVLKRYGELRATATP